MLRILGCLQLDVSSVEALYSIKPGLGCNILQFHYYLMYFNVDFEILHRFNLESCLISQHVVCHTWNDKTRLR